MRGDLNWKCTKCFFTIIQSDPSIKVQYKKEQEQYLRSTNSYSGDFSVIFEVCTTLSILIVVYIFEAESEPTVYIISKKTEDAQTSIMEIGRRVSDTSTTTGDAEGAGSRDATIDMAPEGTANIRPDLIAETIWSLEREKWGFNFQFLAMKMSGAGEKESEVDDRRGRGRRMRGRTREEES